MPPSGKVTPSSFCLYNGYKFFFSTFLAMFRLFTSNQGFKSLTFYPSYIELGGVILHEIHTDRHTGGQTDTQTDTIVYRLFINIVNTHILKSAFGINKPYLIAMRS